MALALCKVLDKTLGVEPFQLQGQHPLVGVQEVSL